MSSTINNKQVKDTLSSPRLSTYMRETSDLDSAIQLYLWNANLSGAFLPCLHICEVTIRNAVSDVLSKRHGNKWPWEKGFIKTLPYTRKKDLEDAGAKFSDVNKVIPELNFVFWQSMFTSRHDNQLWTPYFRATFPHADVSISVDVLRAEIYNDLEKLRKLRNRIAHHEPIFKRNLDEDYKVIMKIIGYRCRNTAQWLDVNQNVVSLLENRP